MTQVAHSLAVTLIQLTFITIFNYCHYVQSTTCCYLRCVGKFTHVDLGNYLSADCKSTAQLTINDAQVKANVTVYYTLFQDKAYQLSRYIYRIFIMSIHKRFAFADKNIIWKGLNKFTLASEHHVETSVSSLFTCNMLVG